MSKIAPGLCTPAGYIDKSDFADMLNNIRSFHWCHTKCLLGRKSYLKVHFDAIIQNMATMEPACRADGGILLLAALNLKSDARIACADGCDRHMLWEYTGLDTMEMNSTKRILIGPDRPEELGWNLALHVLKINDTYPQDLQRCFRVSLHEKRRREFADAFPSLSKMINSVDLGWSGEFDGNWTIPERNGYGDVCNFLCFDSKFNIKFRPNSRGMGLILPRNWRTGGRPLYVVDDPKKMLRALASGYRVICRQAERRSLIDLAILLRSVPGQIVLLERNDRELDKVADAKYLSETLSRHLGRAIPVQLSTSNPPPRIYTGAP